MEKSDVEKILKYYNEIDDDIRICKEYLVNLEDNYYDTISAIKYNGMPKSTCLSDEVANVAIRNVEYDVKSEVDFIQDRIKELNKIRMEILKELTGMNMMHKKVLTSFYINGQKWEQISEQIGYSVRQSQNHRVQALEIMAKKMTQNRYILESEVVRKILD